MAEGFIPSLFAWKGEGEGLTLPFHVEKGGEG